MAQVSNEGGEDLDDAERLRFLEHFPLLLLDREKVERRLKERNVSMVTPGGRPLSEAVWDSLHAMVGGRGNGFGLSYDAFLARIHSLQESEAENYLTLQVIANNFSVAVRVLTSLSPLLPDLEVTPHSVPVATVEVVHLCGALYSGLSNRRPPPAVAAHRPPPTADVRPPPAVPPQLSTLSEHMRLLLDRLASLRHLQRQDDFSTTSVNGKEEKYTVLGTEEAAKRIREQPSNYWRCKLSLQGPHEGLAEALCPPAGQERVRLVLRGRRNCGMAFDGDEVAVRVFRNQRGEPTGGRVVGVLKSTVMPVNRVFLCRVSRDQTTLMRPICGTVPKIHVAHDGAEEQYEINMASDLDIYNFNAKYGSHTAGQEARARKEFARKCMVSIYKEEVSGENLTFGLDKVHTIDRTSCEDLFVVIYRKWTRTFFYPLGHVVGLVSPSAGLEDAVALLRLQCQLPHPHKPDSPAWAEANVLYRRDDTNKERKRRMDFRAVPTFSIDSRDTRDVDDVISVRRVDGGLEIGVHITDVAHYIRQDSFLDRAARERGFSAYGLSDLTLPVHMFPDPVATDRLSLLEGKERLCLGVLFLFDTDCRPMERPAAVVRSLVRSDAQMNRAEATSLLRARPHDSETPVESAMREAWRVARAMRRRRLLAAANVDDEDYESMEDVGSYSDADALVEELMIAANVHVAKFLLARYPDTPLRVNPPPSVEAVEAFLTAHRSVARHSGSLQRELGLAGFGERLYSERVLLLNPDVGREVTRRVERKDFDGVFRLLACERLHPQLLTAIGEWRGHSASFYRRAGEQDQHFKLGEEAYLHFTSPLRRYADVLVQRLVHTALDSKPSPLPSSLLDPILLSLNAVESRHRRYHSLLSQLSLYTRCSLTPLSLPCPVSLSSSHLTLSHAFISRLPRSQRSLPFSRLAISRLPEPTFWGPGLDASPRGVALSWRERLFVVDRGLREGHPGLRAPMSRGSGRVDVRNAEPAFRLVQTRRGVYKGALPNLLGFFPGPQWIAMWNGLRVEPAVNETEKWEDASSEVRRERDRSVRMEERGRIVLEPAIEVGLDLEASRAIRAQFHAPVGARVRTPAVQYLQICPSLGICVEHRASPVACFASVTAEEVSETREFNSVQDYCAAWLPLIRMEAASQSAAAQGEGHHLSGVEVQWMTDGDRLGGVIRLSKSFCLDPYRQIKPRVGGRLSDCLNSEESYLELLCIRVQLDGFVWICHAGVKYCGEEGDDYVRFFVVHQLSSAFPPEMVEEKKLATVEVIVKGLGARYQESAVGLLSRSHNSIAAKLVLGRFLKADAGSMRQQHFLRLLREQKFRSGQLYTAPPNDAQRQAVERAFLWQVSLIWGPPGTGKTITGVQIAFWWAEFNRRLNPQPEEEEEEDKDDKDKDEDIPTPQSKFPDVWAGYQTAGKKKRRKRKKKKKKEEEEEEKDAEEEEQGKGKEDPLTRWVDFPEVGPQSPKKPLPLNRRRRQVVYCGPSNDCVNCVAEYLRTKVASGHLSLVRVFSSQVEKKEFPVPGQDSVLHTPVTVPETLHDMTLHRLVRREDKPHATVLRGFDMAFARVQLYLDGGAVGVSGRGRPLRLTWGNHENLLRRLRKAIVDYRAVLSAAKSEELGLHDVILCTTTVAASFLVQQHCRFCQVIIDEAGMCTEAETLVPLSPVRGPQSASAAIENVVLIGDHKQLRPIITCQEAAERGLERSMLQRHWTIARHCGNRTMLTIQYRMHPSICEFPSAHVYRSKLRTGVSALWTGVESVDLEPALAFSWTGLDGDHSPALRQRLLNSEANVLAGEWPGVRCRPFSCLPGITVTKEEERIVFLHVEGDEQSLLVSTADGNENSKSNLAEAVEAVRIYLALRSRFSRPRAALSSVAVLSQYQHQVHLVRERLQEALREARSRDTIASRFRRPDPRRKEATPIVSSVVRSQGSEFDYVILSTVRSLPDHDIDPNPTPGWEKKYLGFITDINQINVAITRARRGLVIIGNGKLLQVHHFWRDLLNDLRERGCYLNDSRDFLKQT